MVEGVLSLLLLGEPPSRAKSQLDPDIVHVGGMHEKPCNGGNQETCHAREQH